MTPAIERIPALSIHNSADEPYATAIAYGLKTIEMRTRKTNYRGPLVICATKFYANHFGGKAVCMVDLVDCRPMLGSDAEAAMMPEDWHVQDAVFFYAWVLANPRPVPHIGVTGRQGLFYIRPVVDIPPDDVPAFLAAYAKSATASKE